MNALLTDSGCWSNLPAFARCSNAGCFASFSLTRAAFRSRHDGFVVAAKDGATSVWLQERFHEAGRVDVQLGSVVSLCADASDTTLRLMYVVAGVSPTDATILFATAELGARDGLRLTTVQRTTLPHTAPLRIFCLGAAIVVSHFSRATTPEHMSFATSLCVDAAEGHVAPTTTHVAGFRLADAPVLCADGDPEGRLIVGCVSGLVVGCHEGVTVWTLVLCGPVSDVCLFVPRAQPSALGSAVASALGIAPPRCDDFALTAVLLDGVGSAVARYFDDADCPATPIFDGVIESPPDQCTASVERGCDITSSIHQSMTVSSSHDTTLAQVVTPPPEPPVPLFTGFTLAGGPLACTAVDIDGDGWLELFITTASGRCAVCQRRGANDYHVVRVLDTPSSELAVMAVRAADGLRHIVFSGPHHAATWRPRRPYESATLVRERVAQLSGALDAC